MIDMTLKMLIVVDCGHLLSIQMFLDFVVVVENDLMNVLMRKLSMMFDGRLYHLVAAAVVVVDKERNHLIFVD
jgi:hypothetical protein